MNLSSVVNTSLIVPSDFSPVSAAALAPVLAAAPASIPAPVRPVRAVDPSSVPFPGPSAAAAAASDEESPSAAAAAAAPAHLPRPSAAAASAPSVMSPATVETAVPSFITTASLITVSGGTTAVTLMWTVAKTLFGKSADMPVIPFGCAMVVGAVIYWLSVEDKKVRLSTKEKVAGGFIAFLNSLVLFTASLGIHGR